MRIVKELSSTQEKETCYYMKTTFTDDTVQDASETPAGVVSDLVVDRVE